MACGLEYGKPRSRRLWSFSRGHGANPLYSVPVTPNIHILTPQWPYTYDSCDVGTAPNQTLNGLPLAAVDVGDPYNGNVLSYLQGQKLSRCTCAGDSHPGPMHSDGTFVGRSAPEIDVFEATVCSLAESFVYENKFRFRSLLIKILVLQSAKFPNLVSLP